MKFVEILRNDRPGLDHLDDGSVKPSEADRLLDGLDSNERSAFFHQSNTRTLSAGEFIFWQGNPVTHIYMVVDGMLKLGRTMENGEESVIFILTSGDIHIEPMALFDGCHFETAAALTRSRVLAIPIGIFLEMALNDSRVARNILTIMADRIRRLIDRVEELSLKSAYQRLASYLVTLCSAEQGGQIVRLPLEKCLIARNLGMKPETLSRSFARLRSVGVGVNGSTVSIRDISRLRAYGCMNTLSETSGEHSTQLVRSAHNKAPHDRGDCDREAPGYWGDVKPCR